jgi:hypothetical protein
MLKQSFPTHHSSIPTFQSFKNITNLFLNQFPGPLTLQFRHWTSDSRHQTLQK